MGQVYRATDTKLKRQVAIKILPPLLASDPDRLARFQREAEVLASLNHPNIAGIYGLEESAGVTALVMELVEGEDLSRDIARGAIPVAEALPIAKQIAEALEAAHEQGIMHRDLKPANVKVREDGTVKVLDFGLAKALEPALGQDQDAMTSPTLTARATQQGLIIGTAAYMAPEQARGRAVDRRADIWAFGVVLYEMLCGKRPFAGDDVSSTLASVLKDHVDWTALPADLPSPVTRLLRRCLDKDPKRRLSAIADARLELDDARTNPEPVLPSVVSHASWWRALPWAFGVLGLSAGAAAVLLWAPRREPATSVPARLSAETGMQATFAGVVGARAVISPAGNVLVFAAALGTSPSRSQLYVRRLTELQAVPLAGTEGAMAPFFRPDGQWVAFFANGKLKKVAIAGGPPVTLCDAGAGRGGWWGEDGTIVFSPDQLPDTVLHRVSDTGGMSQPVTALAENEVAQRWPQVLPGGRAVLYSANTSTTSNDWNLGRVMVTDPRRRRAEGDRARRVLRTLRAEWACLVHPRRYALRDPFRCRAPPDVG